MTLDRAITAFPTFAVKKTIADGEPDVIRTAHDLASHARHGQESMQHEPHCTCQQDFFGGNITDEVVEVVVVL